MPQVGTAEAVNRWRRAMSTKDQHNVKVSNISTAMYDVLVAAASPG
jgi:hypothetical protein